MPLLMVAIIIFLCIGLNIFSGKIGVPMLLAFILLGMIFGADGLVKIDFYNFEFAEKVCSIALIFIMFYGGFGTNWKEAKPVALKAGILASIGVVMTAGVVGIFAHFVLGMSVLNSLLIGAVIGSTDAASVFSILREKHLNLKYNTASLLEVESGSNDPFAYMFTMVILEMMQGNVSTTSIIWMVFLQIFVGVAFGVGTAYIAKYMINKSIIKTPGFDMVFVIAVALFSYAAPNMLGGNGYLSVYITGIILGNSDIQGKRELVPFFDGLTSMMQMAIFFILGLLAYPSRFPAIIPHALMIAIFITFIARPIAIFILLKPFKAKLNQIFLVSWAGFRGAASIVFAIMATLNMSADYDLFHSVFFIVLLSILVQGSLLAFVAKKVDMIDDTYDVMKTFSDYSTNLPIEFIQLTIDEKATWSGKRISEIEMPPGSLIVLVKRGGQDILPHGQTILFLGDTIVLAARSIDFDESYRLVEEEVTKDVLLRGDTLAKLRLDGVVMVLMRDTEFIIPNGDTRLLENDILVINKGVI